MINIEHFEEAIPSINTGHVKRRAKFLRKRAIMKARRAHKKAHSRTSATIRRQYFVWNALHDTQTAIRLNEDIYLFGLLFTTVIVFGGAYTLMNLMILFLVTAYELSQVLGVNMALLGFGVTVATGILYAWIIAFLLNLQSISLLEGLNRKVYRSIRKTLRNSLRYASRLVEAWIFLATVIIAPLSAMAIFLYTYSAYIAHDAGVLLTLAPYAAITGTAWVVIALLNLSLVPHIALFNPTLNSDALFRESLRLVSRRGRMFTLACYVFCGGLLAGAYWISSIIDSTTSIGKTLPMILFSLAILSIFNALMLMLYRKRRLARTY